MSGELLNELQGNGQHNGAMRDSLVNPGSEGKSELIEEKKQGEVEMESLDDQQRKVDDVKVEF